MIEYRRGVLFADQALALMAPDRDDDATMQAVMSHPIASGAREIIARIEVMLPDAQPEQVLGGGARVHVCENGCPIIAIYGIDGSLAAEIHLEDGEVEPFVEHLRAAEKEGAALRRPKV
jgi:hypothetical protein